ncbi:MAG: hypothetical protein HQ503_00585 [Rhodospirillales bacterium]|nr:hypothetical protein [Rhodospirillales bacterium]
MAVDPIKNTYSAICPTRGRPDRMRQYVESALETATEPDRMQFLYYVDNDDPALKQYETEFAAIAGNCKAGTIDGLIGPPIGVPAAANKLAAMAPGNILVTANDDQVHIDVGWDTRLDTEIAKYTDGIYCMWFNDGWEAGNFCTFPVVSKRWFEILGYLNFPFFEHFFCDAWIWMLAKSVDRAIYIPEILIEHRHWKTGKSEMDGTYEKHASATGDSRHTRDREVIDRFERYFLADVEALKAALNLSEFD